MYSMYSVLHVLHVPHVLHVLHVLPPETRPLPPLPPFSLHVLPPCSLHVLPPCSLCRCMLPAAAWMQVRGSGGRGTGVRGTGSWGQLGAGLGQISGGGSCGQEGGSAASWMLAYVGQHGLGLWAQHTELPHLLSTHTVCMQASDVGLGCTLAAPPAPPPTHRYSQAHIYTVKHTDIARHTT